MSAPARYEAAEFGFDPDGQGIAVGVFPDGPLLTVNTSGFTILAVVADAAAPVSAQDVVRELRSQMSELPADIDEQVSQALAGFADQGVLRRVTEAAAQ